jgi:hypothetical protein
MSTRTLLPLAAAAVALTAPAAANADTLLAPAPEGSAHLAFGGGWLAWSQPDGGRHRLVLRAPDGTVSTPAIGSFAAPVDAAIGSTGHAVATKRLVAVYERDGDVLQLDLVSGDERPVPGASTRSYREHHPSIQAGGIAFVRAGGRHDGVVFRSSRGRAVRVSRAQATATATNGSRVAFTTARAVHVRRISGEGRPMQFDVERPRDLQLTRYQAAWRTGAGLFATGRFGGSGEAGTTTVREATTTPEGLVSFAVGASTNAVRYLDAEGVKAPAGRVCG